MSHTDHDDVMKLFKRGRDCLSDARSAKSSERDWSPLRKKCSSNKSNLNDTQPGGSDGSPSLQTFQLNCIQPSGNDSTNPSEGLEAVAEGTLLNSCIENSKHFDALLKASDDFQQTLRQIIRTAYQFTRHSHRQKLTVKDLEKAFKIHHVNINPNVVDSLIDKYDIDSVESGKESQPFTCTGVWLKKP